MEDELDAPGTKAQWAGAGGWGLGRTVSLLPMLQERNVPACAHGGSPALAGYLCLVPLLTRSSMSRTRLASSGSRLFSGDMGGRKHRLSGPEYPDRGRHPGWNGSWQQAAPGEGAKPKASPKGALLCALGRCRPEAEHQEETPGWGGVGAGPQPVTTRPSPGRGGSRERRGSCPAIRLQFGSKSLPLASPHSPKNKPRVSLLRKPGCTRPAAETICCHCLCCRGGRRRAHLRPCSPGAPPLPQDAAQTGPTPCWLCVPGRDGPQEGTQAPQLGP